MESTKFVQEWDAMLAGSPDRIDQIAFNTLVAKHTSPLRKSVKNSRLATGPKRQLAVGVLPVPLFLNGHTFFIQGLHKVSFTMRLLARPAHFAVLLGHGSDAFHTHSLQSYDHCEVDGGPRQRPIVYNES